MIAGDNLFEFSLSRLRRASGASKGTRARSPSATSARSSSRRSYGIVELDDDDRVRRLRREAGGPAVDARRDRDVPLPPRARAARPHVPRRAGIRPTSRAGSSRWLHQREPVYGWAFDDGWFDIGDHEQLLEADNRLPSRARACPSARRVLARLAVTHSAQRRHRHVTRSPVAWSAWLVDLLLPPRCVSCGAACGARSALRCRARAAAARGRRAARRCGAPTAWPVERCRECAGRRLAFASARAAVAYAGPARPLVRAWKERGLRHARSLRRRARRRARRRGRRRTSSPISRPTRSASSTRGHHPAERLARELGRALGARPCAPLLDRAARRPSGRRRCRCAERRRNVRGAFAAVARRAGDACCSSTTSTRRAPPSCGAPRSALRSGGRRARSTWSTFADRALCEPVRRRPRLRSEDATTTKEATMRLQVKGKNVEVTPSIREYAERKLAKLEKQLAEQTQVEVELSEQKNPSIAGEPRRRGDDLHEGADAARARGLARHEGVDRPARRQARAAGEALPRDAASSSRAATPTHHGETSTG